LEKELPKYKSLYLELLHHEICRNTKHLEEKLNEIIQLKGEGLILRNPTSRYENRRSKSMLKVKRFHDAEATVINILKDTGRLTNLMGSISEK
jgi:DNA ligase-1